MIYLDECATMKPNQSALQELIRVSNECWFNPSSEYGDMSIVEDAKETVAKVFHCKPSEVIFTSGGSENNSWWTRGRNNYVSCVEHKSMFGENSYKLNVLPNGELDINELYTHRIHKLGVMYVNNELGTVNDLKTISNIIHGYGGLVYSDCTQAVGKIDVKFDELGVDAIGFSGHKIGTIKGIGVMIGNAHLLTFGILTTHTQYLFYHLY